MGWAMITMVEGISRGPRAEIGALILNQNKHFHLAEVYAILIAILALGLLLDYLMGVCVRVLLPYVIVRQDDEVDPLPSCRTLARPAAGRRGGCCSTSTTSGSSSGRARSSRA